MAITERNNGLRHILTQPRKHIEVSQDRRTAKQGAAFVNSVVKKADDLQSSRSGDLGGHDCNSASA